MDRHDLKLVLAVSVILTLIVVIPVIALGPWIIQMGGRTRASEVKMYKVGTEEEFKSYDWGELDEGSYIKQADVKNVGLVTATLHMVCTEDYPWLAIVWDREDYILGVDLTVTATFTLTITEAPLDTNFSFDVNIYG